MQIAVTSQNAKSITEHAGKCRKFWIYDIEQGKVSGKHLLELPIEQSFHASHHELAQPLARINVLITASMGAGLHHRLTQAGILPVLTFEEDPDAAISAFLENRLDRLPLDRKHACKEDEHLHAH